VIKIIKRVFCIQRKVVEMGAAEKEWQMDKFDEDSLSECITANAIDE